MPQVLRPVDHPRRAGYPEHDGTPPSDCMVQPVKGAGRKPALGRGLVPDYRSAGDGLQRALDAQGADL